MNDVKLVRLPTSAAGHEVAAVAKANGWLFEDTVLVGSIGHEWDELLMEGVGAYVYYKGYTTSGTVERMLAEIEASQ